MSREQIEFLFPKIRIQVTVPDFFNTIGAIFVLSPAHT